MSSFTVLETFQYLLTLFDFFLIPSPPHGVKLHIFNFKVTKRVFKLEPVICKMKLYFWYPTFATLAYFYLFPKQQKFEVNKGKKILHGPWHIPHIHDPPSVSRIMHCPLQSFCNNRGSLIFTVITHSLYLLT
jgi:hypothetical protein